MLLSAVSVLVVAQSSSEIPEGLMNNPVCFEQTLARIQEVSCINTASGIVTLLQTVTIPDAVLIQLTS